MKMDFSAKILNDNETLSATADLRYLLLLKGNCICWISNQKYELKQHDIMFIPENKESTFRCNSERGLIFGLIELKEFDSFIQTPCVYPANKNILIHKLYDLGLETQDITLPFYETINELIGQLMFTALVAVGSQLRKINEQVFQVINDINDNYTNAEYDVKNAIEKTGYTTNHFRKKFQDETGISPNEFVTKRRFDHAESLIRQFKNQVSIKEIAFQCGYKDPYYFSRMFKQHYGVSPQQYIEEL